MGGGVNPIEWVLPPVAITHTLVDQSAKNVGALIGTPPLPPVPGSADANAKLGEAKAAQQAQTDLANQQAKQTAQDLAARTETPQEALDARRRAQASATGLSAGGYGGKRRASTYLAGTSL